MFVTSPSPDNLHTLFEFIFKGFDALQYQVIITGHKGRYDLFTTGPSYLKRVCCFNTMSQTQCSFCVISILLQFLLFGIDLDFWF